MCMCLNEPFVYDFYKFVKVKYIYINIYLSRQIYMYIYTPNSCLLFCANSLNMILCYM